MCRTDMEAIKTRLAERLRARNVSARALAILLGEDEKNVQRWAYQKEKIPADFIGACETKGFVSARWLVTGDGSPEPSDPSQAERILAEIRRILEPPREVEDAIALARLADDVDPPQEGVG